MSLFFPVHATKKVQILFFFSTFGVWKKEGKGNVWELYHYWSHESRSSIL